MQRTLQLNLTIFSYFSLLQVQHDRSHAVDLMRIPSLIQPRVIYDRIWFNYIPSPRATTTPMYLKPDPRVELRCVGTMLSR